MRFTLVNKSCSQVKLLTLNQQAMPDANALIKLNLPDDQLLTAAVKIFFIDKSKKQ
jgi:hypothetical protein